MEDFKNQLESKEQDILFSKSIKAGKRIYYLDVKKNRRNDMFLAITESKKIVNGVDENVQVSYEKHKIFLYKEDFEKFLDGLSEVVDFIRSEQSADSHEQEDYPAFSDSSFAFKMDEFEK